MSGVVTTQLSAPLQAKLDAGTDVSFHGAGTATARLRWTRVRSMVSAQPGSPYY